MGGTEMLKDVRATQEKEKDIKGRGGREGGNGGRERDKDVRGNVRTGRQGKGGRE